MKRLTKKIDNGRFVTTDAEARSYGETDPEDGFFYNYFTGEAVDKLAAYEDTGLEPADIKELLAAVNLPEHGDLIDRSKLPFVCGGTTPMGMDYVRRYIVDGMPVIVPSNKEITDGD